MQNTEITTDKTAVKPKKTLRQRAVKRTKDGLNTAFWVAAAQIALRVLEIVFLKK